MKRILKILTIGALLLPMSVKADMGAPDVAPYKVIPKSEEGAPYYDCHDYSVIGNIAYNQEVKVFFEEEKDGHLYGDILINEDDDYVCVDLADFMTLTEVYEPDFDSEGTYDYEADYEIYVNGSKGIKMRKGPSILYDIITTIPYETTVKTIAASGDEGVAWAYVSYNGKTGWINMLEETAVYKANPVRFYRDVEVYDIAYGEDQKVIGKIPAQEIVTNIYTISSWTNIAGYYVEYNGLKGYVDDYFVKINEINQDKLDKLEIKANTKIYQKPKDKEVGKIKNKLVTSINGYYISEEMDEETYDFVYETWLCIEYNDEYVWISESSLEKDSKEKFNEYLENATEEDAEIQEIPEKEDEEKEEETKDSSSDKKSTKNIRAKEIVILCVGGAIISALTAIVTIVLVNRKNKKAEKKNEINQSNKVDISTNDSNIQDSNNDIQNN